MRAFWQILVGLGAFVVAIADVPEGLRPWQPWAVLAIGVAAIALATRRRSRPTGAVLALLALVIVAVGAELLDQPGHVSFGHSVVVALLIADVVRFERLPIAAGVGAAALMTAVVTEGLADGRGPGDVVFVAMMWAFAASTALAVRWRTAAVVSRDERVRARERERIARELHDVVAHHVSAIAITAEGARTLVGTNIAAVDRSLHAINTAAVTALDEMHDMVSILRDGEGSAPPRRLDALEEALATDGPVRVHITIGAVSDEPPSAVTAAVYRIAQEAVTNARRHARNPSCVTVDVRSDGDDLVLTVVDDGEGAPLRSGGGFGLDGMIERAEILGGRCVAGPHRSGGWGVEARIPTERDR